MPRRAHRVLAAVSRGYSLPLGRFPRVTHPFATFTTTEVMDHVRLACVRHAASVRSEPGSNSQVDLRHCPRPLVRDGLRTTSQIGIPSRITRNPVHHTTPPARNAPAGAHRPINRALETRFTTGPMFANRQTQNRRPRIPSLHTYNVKQQTALN